jgi:peptidoglycan/LPS O-acetylase OafA/YrhL
VHIVSGPESNMEVPAINDRDPPVRPARFIELDSLRGLAALIVVLHHLRLLWQGDAQPASAIARGLNSLVSPVGNGAVILFFVLSGFVLSLPAVAGKTQPYSTFAIRRIFRIYLPYLAALATSVAGAFWLHGIITRSSWFHFFWSEPVDWHLVLQHVMFVGVYNTDQFDNPIWSLVHEMRISLIFPLLCAFVLRFKSKWSLVIAFGLTATAVMIQKQPLLISWQIAESVHIAGLFVLGIFLARERGSLVEWFLRRPRRFAAALIAMTAASLFLYLFLGPQSTDSIERYFPHVMTCIRHWLIALSSGGLMIISMSLASWKRVLHWPPIHFLGEVSYSLYLWHFVVVLYCVHLLYGKLPLLVILCLALILSIAVSSFSYRWIEKPSMNLGRKLSNLFQRSPVNVAIQR